MRRPKARVLCPAPPLYSPGNVTQWPALSRVVRSSPKTIPWAQKFFKIYILLCQDAEPV